MDQMVQMMGQMQAMMGHDDMMGAMDYGSMMAHMDHMIQLMEQMQTRMQSNMGQGGMMGHTMPMTGTLSGATPTP